MRNSFSSWKYHDNLKRYSSSKVINSSKPLKTINKQDFDIEDLPIDKYID